MALPERFHVLVGHKWLTASFRNYIALLVAQYVDPGPARLNLAYNLRQLLLVFQRPGPNFFQHDVDLFFCHIGIITLRQGTSN